MSRVASARYTPLQRGNHNLARADVLASQRGRMLGAMIEVAAELGYGTASVGDVISRAKVSRRTFYEQFADKEDCFCAAYDVAARVLIERLRAALAAPGTPAARVDRMVGAYLAEVEAEPAVARVFLLEAFAAGPDVLARRVQVQESVAALVADALGAETESDRFACRALVHAVISIVTAHVAIHGARRVGALYAPITQLARHTLRGFEPSPPPRARVPARRRS